MPETQGGFDGGPVDMFVVMHELGRALVVEPYWATAAGIETLRLVAAKGSDMANMLLERAARGEIRLSVAFNEPHARYDLFDLRTTATATASADCFALSGTKSMVQHGAQADCWIVPARIDCVIRGSWTGVLREAGPVGVQRRGGVGFFTLAVD